MTGIQTNKHKSNDLFHNCLIAEC